MIQNTGTNVKKFKGKIKGLMPQVSENIKPELDQFRSGCHQQGWSFMDLYDDPFGPTYSNYLCNLRDGKDVVFSATRVVYRIEAELEFILNFYQDGLLEKIHKLRNEIESCIEPETDIKAKYNFKYKPGQKFPAVRKDLMDIIKKINEIFSKQMTYCGDDSDGWNYEIINKHGVYYDSKPLFELPEIQKLKANTSSIIDAISEEDEKEYHRSLNEALILYGAIIKGIIQPLDKAATERLTKLITTVNDIKGYNRIDICDKRKEDWDKIEYIKRKIFMEEKTTIFPKNYQLFKTKTYKKADPEEIPITSFTIEPIEAINIPGEGEHIKARLITKTSQAEVLFPPDCWTSNQKFMKVLPFKEFIFTGTATDVQLIRLYLSSIPMSHKKGVKTAGIHGDTFVTEGGALTANGRRSDITYINQGISCNTF